MTTAKTENRHRVLVVDDHSIVRAGLIALINSAPDICVVGEAASGSEAIRNAMRLQPDVVVLDMRLPDSSGVEVCGKIRERCPHTEVVILTSFTDQDEVLGALAVGAKGYILKSLEKDKVIEAIRTVAKGGSALDPGVSPLVIDGVRTLVQRVRTSERSPADPGANWPALPGLRPKDPSLTSSSRRNTSSVGVSSIPPVETALREQDRAILSLIAQGKTNREIGEVLHLSEKTIRNYVSDMLSRLGFRNRTEAAVYAIQNGLVSLD